MGAFGAIWRRVRRRRRRAGDGTSSSLLVELLQLAQPIAVCQEAGTVPQFFLDPTNGLFCDISMDRSAASFVLDARATTDRCVVFRGRLACGGNKSARWRVRITDDKSATVAGRGPKKYTATVVVGNAVHADRIVHGR